MDNTLALQAFSYSFCPGGDVARIDNKCVDPQRMRSQGSAIAAGGCAIGTRGNTRSLVFRSELIAGLFRRRIRALIAEAKDKPCDDCGGRFPSCAMDLDHVRGAKSFTVSKAVQLAFATTLPRVRLEIAKCEVVCANCHRVRTEARGYFHGRPPRRRQDAA